MKKDYFMCFVLFESHQYFVTVAESSSTDELTSLSMTSNDRLALDAIKSLHRQLDDDADGIVDLSESDEVMLLTLIN